ncbi:DENN domain-containing protein 1A isoform X3 [Denticeps clupeoides]|uniref:DENN domain-containing protein 1A isoform X3 n=1 Tax=Denticeps clupeoides TaxID=299321 RepID=UPI0010A44C65|nr:DENN domain-containing protein 1A-like isoform X3 [Denticeps clupeoides]
MGSRIKESPEASFEVYVEVVHAGPSGSDPEVRRRFPEDYIDQETLQTLPKFCFPFSVDSLSVSQVGQNFTFVLTDIESKQRFGFCRLSSGAHTCHCILSYLPWFEVFYKLLNILADYTLKGQESQWRELLESLHSLSIPEPGVPVHLSVHSYFIVPDTRELPSIPENRNLTEYFVAVDVNNMLHLYASMLYERRVLLCCSKLSTLTACVHGAAAMLYPMYWQHVYIPVLPQHLIDYCCAPMPYLIGVHSSLMEKVRSMALDDIVVLNVDTNTLETPFDDLQSLPNDVVSSLKNRLKKVSTTTGEGVARAFLKAQAALFGSYRSALQIEPGEPITFSEEAFVSHRSSAMRQFVLNAIQLQLFKQFIDGRLDLLNSGQGFSDVFEEEINMGEYAGSDKTYHQWLLTVKKGGGAIFNTVKTKANPAMKTVYKFAKDHAKMGIKEVKSRLKQKELAENGYAAAAEDALRHHAAASPAADGKDSRTWEDRRPITVHFGQPTRQPPPRPPPPRLQRSRGPARPPRPLVPKRPRSNVGLESSPEHYVRPTRHYTVFLSEDSSGDELQNDDDSITCFPDNFLFSAPFEWPQPYRSLKEADLMEGEGGFEKERPQGYTAPSSPVTEKSSDINLLGDIFSYKDGEPENQQLSLAKSLEDLRLTKEPEEQQAKFSYQRMDLSGGERTRTLPVLKHSNPYNKLWSQGLDDMAVPGRTSPTWERPLSVPPLELHEPRPPSRESLGPIQEMLDGSCITIPRPQGRKTPEPIKVLAPPLPLPRTLKSHSGEHSEKGVITGGQEFRQALNMSPLSSCSSASQQQDMDLLKHTEEVDILSLLDPLSGNSTGAGDSENGKPPSKPPPPPRPFPPSLPPFPPVSLNPFAQQAHSYQQHRPLGPSVVGANPFRPTYVPHSGAYFQSHSQTHIALAVPPNVFRQPSPVGTGLPTALGPLRPAFPSAGPPSSSSSGALSSLLDSPSAPTTRPLPKPLVGESDSDHPSQESQDPFGDLLAMAKPAAAAPPKKRVEDLRRQWETFD